MNAASPARCRQVFDALVGRRTGVVQEVQLHQPMDGDADLSYAAASIANSQSKFGELRPAAGGVGRTREDALMAAMCEGLERYLASCCPPGGAVTTSPPMPAVSALDLAAFGSQQRLQQGFPFQPVGPDTPLRWVRGTRLSDGVACGVPAFGVYLPYEPEDGEPPVAPGISTGLACAPSLEAAVLRGMCEVIERDALALTWIKGLAPPQIPDPWLANVAGDLLPPRDTALAFDLTSDVDVPVVWVVCRGHGQNGPLVSVGSACAWDARHAVVKAALEASQDRVYVPQLLEREPEWQPAGDFSNVIDFSYHTRLYSAAPELTDAAFAFLRGSHATSDLPNRVLADAMDVDEARRQVLMRLLDAGHDGAWVDLTPDWAAALGLHVVKVVVPSLLPLHGHHGLPFLGHPRLSHWETAMPHCTRNHTEEIWPFPHPFA